MLYRLEVGKLFKEGITKYYEGAVFDIDDSGFNLRIYFSAPSNKEIKEIEEGKIKIGYYTDGQAIFMLFKFGELNWVDAPYSIHLSKNLTKIQDINDGQGFSFKIYFIDASTGILKVMRLACLSTNFSKKIKTAIEKQSIIPFEGYDKKVNEIYMKYSTKKLVEYADLICKIL